MLKKINRGAGSLVFDIVGGGGLDGAASPKEVIADAVKRELLLRL